MRAFTRLVVCALIASLLGSASLIAQTASFGGTVLIDPTEKPLANAEIVFTALNRSARSDSAGNFLFSGLPYGKHAVVVRLVGYESINTDVTLTNGKPVEVDLLLKPTTQKLANVEVKGAASPYAMRLADFEERRKAGGGKFLTADFFEKNDGRPVSSFLAEQIAGIKFVQTNGRHWVASARGVGVVPIAPGTMEKVPRACYMQVVVNGLVRFNGTGQSMFDIDEIDAKTIIGFEYHTTATTPLQYNGTSGVSGCGTVIIWTK